MSYNWPIALSVYYIVRFKLSERRYTYTHEARSSCSPPGHWDEGAGKAEESLPLLLFAVIQKPRTDLPFRVKALPSFSWLSNLLRSRLFYFFAHNHHRGYLVTCSVRGPPTYTEKRLRGLQPITIATISLQLGFDRANKRIGEGYVSSLPNIPPTHTGPTLPSPHRRRDFSPFRCPRKTSRFIPSLHHFLHPLVHSISHMYIILAYPGVEHHNQILRSPAPALLHRSVVRSRHISRSRRTVPLTLHGLVIPDPTAGVWHWGDAVWVRHGDDDADKFLCASRYVCVWVLLVG